MVCRIPTSNFNKRLTNNNEDEATLMQLNLTANWINLLSNVTFMNKLNILPRLQNSLTQFIDIAIEYPGISYDNASCKTKHTSHDPNQEILEHLFF
jgi:hypothetical protein